MGLNDGTAILEPGATCWRVERASRAAVLVDTDAYFRAFVDAASHARKSIMIAGWDVDSRVRLIRDGDKELTLVQLLHQLIEKNKNLDIHILGWDYAFIYALEREPLPMLSFGWKTRGPIHFHLDDEHPAGASHHQKIAVIDDVIAFAGGMDFACHRWDTPSHTPDDPHRVDESGEPYGPFHDVQMMVEGSVAAALGDLVRERWYRARGEELARVSASDSSGDLWPTDVQPDFKEVDVAIARTEPAFKGHPEVREVQSLHERAIGAAENLLYIENQYLTSAAVIQALKQKISDDGVGEIVVVLPQQSSGWLERTTMDALRGVRLHSLQKADEHERLHVYSPLVDGTPVMVHSKVMIVDDRFLKIGSSNLSNRSMGLDSECDLAIEATDTNAQHAIGRVRQRLLGEHLGLPPERVSFDPGEGARLIATRADKERRLEPLRIPPLSSFDAMLDETDFVDPERPAKLEEIVEEMSPDMEQDSILRRMVVPIMVLSMLVALALAWRYTRLNQLLSIEVLSSLANSIRGTSALPLYVIGAYVIGGLVVFPHSVLLIATAMVFDPLWAFTYAFFGTMCSCAVTYGVGHIFGRRTMRRLAGGRIERLSKLVARGGVITMAVVRILPTGPFSIVNMILGASHVRFHHFMIGSALGIAPGIVAVTVFTERLKRFVLEPSMVNVAILVGVLVAILGFAGWLRWRLSHRKRN